MERYSVNIDSPPIHRDIPVMLLVHFIVNFDVL